MYRIVLDTDVMFAAFDSPKGASRQLLLHILDGHVQFVLSTPLFVENEAVLTRSASLARFKATAQEVLEILNELCGCAILTDFDYRWRPMAKDPSDDHVLETAINGGAHAIATFNVKDYGDAASRFGIILEQPEKVLRRIKQ